MQIKKKLKADLSKYSINYKSMKNYYINND